MSQAQQSSPVVPALGKLSAEDGSKFKYTQPRILRKTCKLFLSSTFTLWHVYAHTTHKQARKKMMLSSNCCFAF